MRSDKFIFVLLLLARCIDPQRVRACLTKVNSMQYKEFESAMVLLQDARPAIIHNAFPSNLLFVRAKDASGSAWHDPVTAVNGYGGGLSLALLWDGRPAVSYSISGFCYFSASNNWNGSTWRDRVTLDASVGFYRYTSLILLNDGRPAVAYYDPAQDALLFCTTVSKNGSMWLTPVTVHTRPSLLRLSLALLDDGRPSIAFGAASGLFFIAAVNCNGGTWYAPIAVDPAGSRDATLTILNDNNLPAISYYTVVKYCVMYALYQNVHVRYHRHHQTTMALTNVPDHQHVAPLHFPPPVSVAHDKRLFSYCMQPN